MNSPKAANLALDRTALAQVAEPILRAHGAELVDVEYKTEPGGWVLRFYVEKLGSSVVKADTKSAAVDLELCANVARELSPALDVLDAIPHKYSLEVSSPGVERPLRTQADFERFAGSKAKVVLHEPVDGQKVFVGHLGSVDGDGLHIEVASKTHIVKLENIQRARLVFEFGSSQPAKGRARHAGPKQRK